MKTNWSLSSLFEWAGRITAVALAVFWGAFFLEHLVEWFTQGGDGRYPPPFVWFAQILHGAMILGLALTAFRPAPGVIATIIGSAAFFGWIRAFPSVGALNLIPITLVGISLLLKMGQRQHGTEGGIA